MADNGSFRTSNSTEESAWAMDQAQYDGDEGPCLQALRTGRQVHAIVGTDTRRWPQFEAKAQELGVTAVLSTPLNPALSPTLGALNIYARHEDGFDDTDAQRAEAIAEHAAILVGNAVALVGATELNHQLRRAVASREIIGQAKGIIMERQSCTPDEAFEVLRRASQRENRKLRDLAEEFVHRVEARRSGARPTA